MNRKKLRGVYDKLVNTIVISLKILTFTKRDTLREAKLKNFVRSSLTIISRSFVKKFLSVEWKKNSNFVEKKYDQLSGSYIDYKYHKGKQMSGFYYVDNVIKKISYFEQDKNIMNEYYKVLSEYKFKNILEVGAGELTTLGSMASFLGDDIEYYAMDLSLNRVYQGREDFLKRHNCKLQVCKANAVALPYPDNFFDMVFTSHCLEHMPYDYKKAIDEMCRVAKKVIVLFEPSYEMGTFSQKIKMKASDYVRGIPNYVNSIKNVRLSKHFFLKNGSFFNRTACHVIEVKKSQDKKKDFNYSCPFCKTKLKEHKTYLLCPHCEKLYFIFEGIPLLDDKYSFYVGNKYKQKLKEE